MATSELGAHEGAVDALQVSGGGVFSAGRDGTLRRWPEGQVVARCDDGDWITCLTKGAAGTARGFVLFLDETGTVSDRKRLMEYGVGDIVAVGPGRFFACGDDNRIELFDGAGKRSWSAVTYKFPYAFDVEGRELLIATWDAYLYRLDHTDPPAGTLAEPAELPYPEHPGAPMPFFDVVALGDGRVAVGTHEASEHYPDHVRGTLHVWQGDAGTADWRQALGPIYALAFDPERQLLAAGGEAGTVTFWAPSGEARGRVALPERSVATEVYVPAVAEFDVVAPNAVTALTFDDSGALFVGTAAGSVFRVTPPDP